MRLVDMDVAVPEYFPGYKFREFAVGDENGMLAALDLSFPEYEWNLDKLREQTTEHPHRQGCFVVEGPRGVAATVTALVWPGAPDEGYVHWLAVHPHERGRRLGALAMLSLVRFFRGLGLSSCVLDTDDFRLPALKTYLDLGFEPVMVEEGHAERWAQVRLALGGESGAERE